MAKEHTVVEASGASGGQGGGWGAPSDQKLKRHQVNRVEAGGAPGEQGRDWRALSGQGGGWKGHWVGFPQMSTKQRR